MGLACLVHPHLMENQYHSSEHLMENQKDGSLDGWWLIWMIKLSKSWFQDEHGPFSLLFRATDPGSHVLLTPLAVGHLSLLKYVLGGNPSISPCWGCWNILGIQHGCFFFEDPGGQSMPSGHTQLLGSNFLDQADAWSSCHVHIIPQKVQRLTSGNGGQIWNIL